MKLNKILKVLTLTLLLSSVFFYTNKTEVDATTKLEMMNPNPYGSASYDIINGSSIKVYKAPSSVSFGNVKGSQSGLTFAMYENDITYCLQPGSIHGSGTLTSDPFAAGINETIAKDVAKWARAAEYYQVNDSANWGEYVGVAQDKIWAIMGRTDTDPSVSSIFYNRVENYKNALDNQSLVTANFPANMVVGQSYEVTVVNGKVYNHVQKLSDNFDISLSNNAINNDPLNLNSVYTVIPTSSGILNVSFWSEAVGTEFSAKYIYGSNQNLFIGEAIDPSNKLFTTYINGEVEISAQKFDEDGNEVGNVEIEFSLTKDFTNSQKSITDENGQTEKVKFDVVNSSTTVYARETKVPENMVLDTTVKKMTVNAGETATFSFVNDFRIIDIGKIDGETFEVLENSDIELWEKIGNVNDLKLAVSEVQLRNTIDEKIKTLDNGDIIRYKYSGTTDEDGKLIFSTKDIKSNTTYYIREIKSPLGYVLNTDFINIGEVDEKTKALSYTLENTKIKGDLKLLKKDSNTLELITDSSALFELYKFNQLTGEWNAFVHNSDYQLKNSLDEFEINTEGQVIIPNLLGKENDDNLLLEVNDNIYVTKNGQISLKDLDYGTYATKEVISPLGYKIYDEMLTFEIDENGTEVEVIAYNETINSKISISKVDSVTGELVGGAQMQIDKFNQTTGEWEYYNTSITIDDEVLEVIVNEVSLYRVNEIVAPDGYAMEELNLEFIANGDDIELVYPNTKIPVPDTGSQNLLSLLIVLSLILLASKKLVKQGGRE